MQIYSKYADNTGQGSSKQTCVVTSKILNDVFRFVNKILFLNFTNFCCGLPTQTVLVTANYLPIQVHFTGSLLMAVFAPATKHDCKYDMIG